MTITFLSQVVKQSISSGSTTGIGEGDNPGGYNIHYRQDHEDYSQGGNSDKTPPERIMV